MGARSKIGQRTVSAFGERGGIEPQVAYAKRRKSGLEVPLVGRMYREKLLVFAPPLWHDILVGLCILMGAYGTVLQIRGADSAAQIPGGYFTTVGVLLAGLWGALSNERMVCDLRAKTYVRIEGMGPGKRACRGKLGELEAMVLTAEQYAHGTGIQAMVYYRLILYWRGQRHPPLVAEKERHFVSFGSPLNTAVQPMLYRGLRYAQALGVPYYDNSHLSGKSPVPIV